MGSSSATQNRFKELEELADEAPKVDESGAFEINESGTFPPNGSMDLGDPRSDSDDDEGTRLKEQLRELQERNRTTRKAEKNARLREEIRKEQETIDKEEQLERGRMEATTAQLREDTMRIMDRNTWMRNHAKVEAEAEEFERAARTREADQERIQADTERLQADNRRLRQEAADRAEEESRLATDVRRERDRAREAGIKIREHRPAATVDEELIAIKDEVLSAIRAEEDDLDGTQGTDDSVKSDGRRPFRRDDGAQGTDDSVKSDGRRPFRRDATETARTDPRMKLPLEEARNTGSVQGDRGSTHTRGPTKEELK